MTLDDKSLAAILSEFVAGSVVVSSGDLNIHCSPYSQERELVSNAVVSRRIEFFSGRYHARLALKKLNCSAAPILRGKRGNPLWPSGVLGSITHDLGGVVVAAMAAGEHRGFGIDLVINPARIEESLQPLIALPTELNLLARHCKGHSALALAFSLKESIVKAISPSIDCYLELMDIQITPIGGEIRAQLARFEATFRCGFIPVTDGLLTYALLE